MLTKALSVWSGHETRKITANLRYFCPFET
jgi:hypothetical protein